MSTMRIVLIFTVTQLSDHPVYEREIRHHISEPFEVPTNKFPGLSTTDIDMIWDVIARTNKTCHQYQRIHLADQSQYTFLLHGRMIGCFYNSTQHITVQMITADLVKVLSEMLSPVD